MIRAVLFDMDGTLLDSEKIYRRTWTQAMKDLKLELDEEQFFRDVSGMNMAGIKSFCKQAYGADFPIEELAATRRAHLMAFLEENLPPLKPGVPQILETLRERGICIVLATSSGYAYATKLVQRLGIDGYFDAVMAGDRVEHGKPHPEIFLRAAELIGCKPEECVVAEDSQNGVRAGYAAGMRTVMIPDLQPCTDELRPLLWYCIDSLWELPTLIEAENLRLGQQA